MAQSLEAFGDQLGKVLRIHQHHDIGPAGADGAGGLLHPPQQQRQALEHVANAHHRQIAHRIERDQPLRSQVVAADAGQRQGDALAQPCHQIGGNAVARRLPGQNEEGERISHGQA